MFGSIITVPRCNRSLIATFPSDTRIHMEKVHCYNNEQLPTAEHHTRLKSLRLTYAGARLTAFGAVRHTWPIPLAASPQAPTRAHSHGLRLATPSQPICSIQSRALYDPLPERLHRVGRMEPPELRRARVEHGRSYLHGTFETPSLPSAMDVSFTVKFPSSRWNMLFTISQNRTICCGMSSSPRYCKQSSYRSRFSVSH